MAYRKVLEKNGAAVLRVSPDGTLPEIVERTDHPWFIGVQFHPELKSKPFEPHPRSRASSRRRWNRAGWCDGRHPLPQQSPQGQGPRRQGSGGFGDRVKFGRSKAEKARDAAEKTITEKIIDAHKRDR